LIRNPSELLILQYWNPFPTPHPLYPSSSAPPPSNPSSWSTPLVDFIKLNFDGASKGNPGAAGYGVVFHNHHGHIILINVGSLGHTTNNAVELWGLIRGLQLAIEHNFTKLIVEGDSQIIINIFSKILNGVDPERISPSWRLSHGLKTITDLMQPNHAVIPAHIRRKANQVADELANLGTNWDGPELLCKMSLNPDHPILQQCIRKAGEVDKPPDGVLLQAKWHKEGVRVGQQGRVSCDHPRVNDRRLNPALTSLHVDCNTINSSAPDPHYEFLYGFFVYIFSSSSLTDRLPHSSTALDWF
jgi:ribonuclease HI